MTLRVCEATLDDLDLLVETRLEVLRSVFSLPEDEDMRELARANRLYYEQSLADKTHKACFVYADEHLAGCGGVCLYTEMPSPENPSGKCGYLMNIHTKPAFRRRGVGALTVHWLVEQARVYGATRITLVATPEGKALYETIGFKHELDFMVYDDSQLTENNGNNNNTI